MTKEILKLTATLLGLDDLVRYLDAEEKDDDELNKTIDEMIIFLNHVTREVTKEYFPLSKCDMIYSNEKGEIKFEQLSENAVAIKEVENSLHLRANFELFASFLRVEKPQSAYFITYNYTPAPIKNLSEEISLPLGLDYFIISYGIASEYALSKLLYDEASMWQSKFVSSLESLKGRTKERRFMARKLK